METSLSSDRLAEAITWAASRQTHYTIRIFADRERRANAYRTYAYFRWVDDHLDEGELDPAERSAFAERQETLMASLYRGDQPQGLSPEETMLAELVRSDQEPDSGLQTYIRDMMAVMVFDARRRGQLVSQRELNDYTRWLAVAVTEAMHYFIGHACCPPREGRYLAVTAAHIVHMLRDAQDDTRAGYINIPREYLAAHHITAEDLHSEAYRAWVRERVELARAYFKAGQVYLGQVPSLRCRLAGYAYLARFSGVLDAIVADGYHLRAGYPQRRALGAGIKMAWSTIEMAWNSLRPALSAGKLPEA